MTVPAGVEGQGTPVTEPVVQPDGTPATPETNSNPLYAEYLEKVPEGMRPLVEPVFKDWDAGVTKQFQALHEQYDPWKPVIDSGFDPSVAQQSLQLVQALENQPQEVLLALAQAYGVELVQQPGEPATPVVPEQPTGSEEGDLELPPALKEQLSQQEQMLQTMGQYLLEQKQQADQAAQDRQLEETLTELRGKHGDFNERYVLALMAQGATPEQAVVEFKRDVAQQAANAKADAAPVVVGSGGGVPASPVDPSQLSDKDTKNLVVQLLAAQHGQRT